MSGLRSRALWGWLALMALAVWGCVRATYVADLSAFLPAAPTGEQRVLMAQLQNGATARVLMIGLRGGEPAQRTEASLQLAEALRGSGLFEAVHNGDHAADAATGEFLFRHRYLFSPAVSAERFTVDGLREGIADTVALLGTPAGVPLKPLLWRDPTGETVRMAEAMLPANAPRSDGGVWVSREQPRALLLATVRADGGDLDGQAKAQALVRGRFAALAATAPGLTLELSGPGVFGVASRTRIQGEVERLATAGTVAMVVLLLVAFGSLRALGIALLPVASGVLAGIAAVDLGFGQIHGMTLGFGTTLIGEAVDYAIYYLVQARAGGHTQWQRTRWPTVRLGLWTSLAGFAALAFSGFAGLAQLGVFSMSGLVAAALTTRYLLPVFAPQGSPGQGLRVALGRMTATLCAALPRWRRPLLSLTLVAAGLLAVLPSPWRGTLAALSPVPADALALDAALRADLGASEAGTLVAIEAPDEATALQRAEQAGARLDALVAQGALLGYDSPARLLPSPATQLVRRAALPEAGVLRERLAQATEGGPLPAAKLGAFIDEVQGQRPLAPVTLADLKTAAPALASAVQAQLTPGGAGQPWTVLMNLQAPPGAQGVDAARLRTALHDLPETRIVQIGAELDALYAHYLQQARWQAGLGALAVVALLAWHLRSARRLGRVLLPLAASVVLVLAGLTLSGQALGILHLVGLLLVAAVGSNYALFFDHLQAVAGLGAADGPDADTLASLLMANVTTVVSFGLLATASVPALAAVGQAVAPGALLALVLSATFMPAQGRHGRIDHPQTPARAH
ncbi:MMPL family transporter [Sphaerotilus sp.]|uniref:MMPL family transporter n=1 Tax=Sphaerotilus sp. TaxID=2093942 RepID=UPI00286DAAC6|nr:MMPL family transporter [Sphaerotilus sp.]